MQHQFLWVGLQVVGLIDIGVGRFSEVVPQNGDLYDQRDLAEAILLNHLIQFGTVVRSKFSFQVALYVA